MCMCRNKRSNNTGSLQVFQTCNWISRKSYFMYIVDISFSLLIFNGYIFVSFEQMGKASSIRLLTCNPLAPLVLLHWLMASGFCCPKDFHPGSCQCKSFGQHRISIKCSGIKHVPRDLPPNTAILWVPSCNYVFVQHLVMKLKDKDNR